MKPQTRYAVLMFGLFFLSTITMVQATSEQQRTTVTLPEEPTKTTGLPTEIMMGGVFPIVKRPDAGRDRRDAFLIAVAEINGQSGADRILPEGVTIVGLVKDDDNSAEGGTIAAKALIAEGADIVIGSSGSSVSAAMAAELGPQKIVQISYASSSPSLSDRTLYPYFMRVAASDADQGVALVHLVEAFGWTKGAVIHTSDSYGTGLIEVFKTEWGGTVITDQQFDPGTTDVSAQIQAIKDAKPEFVLGNFIDVDAATAVKKAVDLAVLDMPWITTDGWSTTATFAGSDKVKDGMQKTIGTTPAPLTGAGYAAFNTTWFDPTWDYLEGPKHSQTTGTAFNAYAPLAYDAVYVAAKGLAAANTTAGDALLAELYDITHEGASGSIKFNDLGEVVGRYEYVQLLGGSYYSIGSWQETATLSAVAIILQDGSVWEIKDNTAALMVAETKDDDTPGFTVPEVLVLLGIAAVGIAIFRRKEKK